MVLTKIYCPQSSSIIVRHEKRRITAVQMTKRHKTSTDSSQQNLARGLLSRWQWIHYRRRPLETDETISTVFERLIVTIRRAEGLVAV